MDYRLKRKRLADQYFYTSFTPVPKTLDVYVAIQMYAFHREENACMARDTMVTVSDEGYDVS